MANRAVSGSSVAVARLIVASGQSAEQHRHPNADEVIYVLRGNVAVHTTTETILLDPADALTIPRGLSHRIENVGDRDAEMMLSYSTGEREYVADSDPPSIVSS